jgi:hypothetical protein
MYLELSFIDWPLRLSLNLSFLIRLKANFDASTDSVVFKYTNFEEKHLEFTMFVNEIDPIGVPVDSDTISMIEDYLFDWDGAPVQQGETIRISFLAGTDGLFTGTISQTGVEKIVLTVDQLNQIGAGDRMVRIERLYSTPLPNLEFGNGSALFTYSSGDHPVVLIP